MWQQEGQAERFIVIACRHGCSPQLCNMPPGKTAESLLSVAVCKEHDVEKPQQNVQRTCSL